MAEPLDFSDLAVSSQEEELDFSSQAEEAPKEEGVVDSVLGAVGSAAESVVDFALAGTPAAPDQEIAFTEGVGLPFVETGLDSALKGIVPTVRTKPEMPVKEDGSIDTVAAAKMQKDRITQATKELDQTIKGTADIARVGGAIAAAPVVGTGFFTTLVGSELIGETAGVATEEVLRKSIAAAHTMLGSIPEGEVNFTPEEMAQASDLIGTDPRGFLERAQASGLNVGLGVGTGGVLSAGGLGARAGKNFVVKASRKVTDELGQSRDAIARNFTELGMNAPLLPLLNNFSKNIAQGSSSVSIFGGLRRQARATKEGLDSAMQRQLAERGDVTTAEGFTELGERLRTGTKESQVVDRAIENARYETVTDDLISAADGASGKATYDADGNLVTAARPEGTPTGLPSVTLSGADTTLRLDNSRAASQGVLNELGELASVSPEVRKLAKSFTEPVESVPNLGVADAKAKLDMAESRLAEASSRKAKVDTEAQRLTKEMDTRANARTKAEAQAKATSAADDAVTGEILAAEKAFVKAKASASETGLSIGSGVSKRLAALEKSHAKKMAGLNKRKAKTSKAKEAALENKAVEDSFLEQLDSQVDFLKQEGGSIVNQVKAAQGVRDQAAAAVEAAGKESTTAVSQPTRSKFTLRQVQAFKKLVGEKLDQAKLNNTANQAGLKRLYGALTDDIEEYVRRVGSPKHVARWERTNDLVRRNRERTGLVQHVLNSKKTGDAIVRSLASTSKTSKESIRAIRETIQKADPKLWNDTAASLLHRLAQGKLVREGDQLVGSSITDFGPDVAGSGANAITLMRNIETMRINGTFNEFFHGPEMRDLGKKFVALSEAAKSFEPFLPLDKENFLSKVLVSNLALGATGTFMGSPVGAAGTVLTPTIFDALMSRPAFAKWLTEGVNQNVRVYTSAAAKNLRKVRDWGKISPAERRALSGALTRNAAEQMAKLQALALNSRDPEFAQAVSELLDEVDGTGPEQRRNAATQGAQIRQQLNQAQ